MPIATNLQRRGAVYYLRLRVPRDLRDRLAQSELIRSLRTTCVRQARHRGAMATRAALALFETVRERGGMLSQTEIDGLLRDFYVHELEEDRLGRLFLAKVDPRALEARVATRPDHEQQIRGDLGLGRTERFAPWRNMLLLAAGRDPEEFPAMALAELAQQVGRVLLEATLRAGERDRGDYGGAPRDPLLASTARLGDPTVGAPAAGLAPEAARPVRDHIERFIAEKKGLTEKSKNDYRRSLGSLDDVVKSIPIGTVTALHVLRFKDTLLATPVNATIRLKTKSIVEAVELNKEARLPTLCAKTINEKYLSNAKTFFAWAKTNRLVGENPSSGISVAVAKRGKASDERDPFTSTQLERIFTAPLFSGCKSAGRRLAPGPEVIKDHRFWAPPLMYCAGARLNELGQLEVRDIEQDDNGWHMSITTQLDPEETGSESEPERHLKTAAARRKIPIHPSLIELGFLAYVDERRRAGDRRLFPLWKVGADGYFSSPASKFYGRFLKAIGVKTPRTSIYSLRHNFKDHLRDALLHPVAQDLLMGHANSSVQARYGSGRLARGEVEVFRAIRFDAIRHLKQTISDEPDRAGAPCFHDRAGAHP